MITLTEKIEARIQECHNLLRGHGLTRPDHVTVRLDLRGQVAGKAVTNLEWGWCTMRVNEILARENEAEYLRQTVAHEYAHFVVQLTYRVVGSGYFRFRRVQPHGREWQHVMRLLGVEPRRCHDYDTTHAEVRKVRKFVYTCACNRDIPLGIVRHRRIASGRTYRCFKCKAAISFLREGV